MASTSQISKDEELFEFAKLSHDLQRMVVMELDLLSFSTLRMCSKATKSVCEECEISGYLPQYDFKYSNKYETEEKGVQHKNSRGRLSKKGVIPTIKWSEIVVSRRNGKIIWESVDDVCRKSRIVSRKLEIRGEVRCSPEIFNRFLQNHAITALYIDCPSYDKLPFSDEFLCLPAMKKLTCLKWLGGIPLFYELLASSSSVASLRASSMELPCSYLDAIHIFLKEWKEGRREIKNIKIHAVLGVDYRTGYDLVAHLEHGILSDLNASTEVEAESDSEDEFYEDSDDSSIHFEAEKRIDLYAYVNRVDGQVLDAVFRILPSSRVIFECS